MNRIFRYYTQTVLGHVQLNSFKWWRPLHFPPNNSQKYLNMAHNTIVDVLSSLFILMVVNLEQDLHVEVVIFNMIDHSLLLASLDFILVSPY